jgi:plastocyanin
MADEPESTETSEESAAPESEGGVALAVREEASPPAVPMSPEDDPKVQQRKTRFWLPLLVPLGSILAVAFIALNLSRVFIASSEESSDFPVFIGIGIILAILIGATVVAALPNLRTSSLILTVAGVLAVVLLAGSLVLGASLPKEEAAAGFQEPKGPAINTLEVDALPTLSFQAKSFDVPGGINQIKYIDKGGSHTLVFDDNAQPGFELEVPKGLSASKVELKPNSTYVIYCTIPGHRAAGMEADIKVGAAGTAPEAGTQTDTPTTTAPGGPTTTVPPDKASQSSTGS